MIQYRFALALAALALSVGLTDVADAYPTTARSGSTSVTGAYRPLDFEFSIIPDSASTVDVTAVDSPTIVEVSLDLFLTGTWTGSGAGYPLLDPMDAGTWELRFSFPFATRDVGTNVVTVSASVGVSEVNVGTLQYLGGGDFPTTGTNALPAGDTPAIGDVFRIYTNCAGPSACPVLKITMNDFDVGLADDDDLVDALAAVRNFRVDLLDGVLAHIGPYECDVGAPGCIELDRDRTNEACLTFPGICGSVRPVPGVSLAEAPEPTTLALFGLGLAGLGWRTRARR